MAHDWLLRVEDFGPTVMVRRGDMAGRKSVEENEAAGRSEEALAHWGTVLCDVPLDLQSVLALSRATMSKQRYDQAPRIQPIGENHRSSILATAEFLPNVSIRPIYTAWCPLLQMRCAHSRPIRRRLPAKEQPARVARPDV